MKRKELEKSYGRRVAILSEKELLILFGLILKLELLKRYHDIQKSNNFWHTKSSRT